MKRITILLITALLICTTVSVEAKPKVRKYSLKLQKKCWKPRGESSIK